MSARMEMFRASCLHRVADAYARQIRSDDPNSPVRRLPIVVVPESYYMELLRRVWRKQYIAGPQQQPLRFDSSTLLIHTRDHQSPHLVVPHTLLSTDRTASGGGTENSPDSHHRTFIAPTSVSRSVDADTTSSDGSGKLLTPPLSAENELQCTQCTRAAQQKCSRCLCTYYCSSDCQMRDWVKHRGSCQKAEVFRPYPNEAPLTMRPTLAE